MEGLIVNTSNAAHNRWEDRDQQPCFYLDDGTPVFEVWYWHKMLKRWFCMCPVYNQTLIDQGVVFFYPGDVAGLRTAMGGLEQAAGIHRNI
jgi:hypothetical protein